MLARPTVLQMSAKDATLTAGIVGLSAMVACMELGFSGGSHSDGTAPEDLFYDDIACTGSETRLVECPRGSSENCGTHEAVMLTCIGQL